MSVKCNTTIHYVVGTVVYIRSDDNTVKRGFITSIVIDKDGIRYTMNGYYYKPDRLFETAEEAFQDDEE